MALLVRQVRLDNSFQPALREPLAAPRLAAVPLGILFVILGHIGGILIPESATKVVGISETA